MTKSLERNGWNWAAVPADVILNKDLTHADVRVYAYLLWRSGKKEHSWPSVQTIADDLHMGFSTAKLSLSHLVRQGWINRKRQMMRSSVTFINEIPFPRTANRIADVRLTGEPTVGYPVSRVNESHINESKGTLGAKTTRAPAPPAITAFRESAKAFPAKGQWPAIEQAIGETSAALALWKSVVSGYILCGWNPRNVDGMLEFFKRGEIPHTNGNGKTSASATPSVKMFDPAAHPSTEVSPEDRARALALLNKRLGK